MNEYIISVMNFFFKKNVQFIKTLRSNYDVIRMYNPCRS